MKPRASLICLTYNKKDLIVGLDKSILKYCTKTPYEINVVDNGSDGTAEVLNGCNIIRHNNLGNFSTMNNMAAIRTYGDILIFINNDMLAQSDFITDMVQVLDQNENVGIVGACLYYPDERLQHSGVMIQPDLYPANIGERAIKECKLDEVKCRPFHWRTLKAFQAVTGACLAIRKVDFMGLGGFHEEFSWAFEDVDLCFRMQFHLKKLCVVSPSSVLTHLESESGGDRNIELNLGLLQGRWRGIVRSDDSSFR